MTLSFRRFGAFAALLLASAVVHAQAYTHQVFLDRDQDAATGCAVATAAGSIAGIEARLTATIAEYPASVQSLTLAQCAGGSFGPETTLSGGYPVGYDLGAGGSDVIEFAVDVAALSGANSPDWTLWFASTGVATGAVDIVGPVTAQGLGGPLQPPANPAPVVIPALDPWAVLLLALAMGVCLAWAARRYRGLLPVLVVGAALSVAGIAWAANYLLDGAIGDWDVAPLANDPAGDPTVDDPGADLRQVFAAREGARLFFRSDVAEAQIEKLIAGLLATTFNVDENPANGTVVGELRAVTTGLGSLLQFQLLGQAPANAFAVDADGTLTVADGSLVDAESTPVFTLDVQVSINGVAALTIQVDVTVTVDGVNEAPVVDAATFSIPEDSVDGAGVGTVTFIEPDTGQAHVFAITAGDAGGVFAIDGTTGAITVADSAQLDFATAPSYSLTVTVTDNGTPALSGSATITIDITETDDPPVAVDDAATVAEDAAATAIDVLANDTDADAGPLLVESVTQPANGTVVITGGGAGLTYAPTAEYCNDGSPVDTFTYTLNGGSVATVSVTVTCVDDDPVAVDDAAAVTEDDAATPILVLANDTDSDGGAAMSIASVTQPANGTVTIAGDTLSLNYQPAADYCNDAAAADTFTYALAPGGSTATVSVTVTCVDDLPVAVDDAATVAEDSGANTIDVLANDTDIDGGPIAVQSVTQPANGSVSITNGGADLSFTANTNYCNDGTPVDSFTYTLNGGASATVSVTVPCGDDAPVAVADAGTVAEDSGANSIDVLANDTDIDGGPIAVQTVTQPANGTVVITNAGADLTYAPNADYCNDGSPLDTFTYTLNGGSNATVSVTVTCANDAPVVDLDADDDKGTGGADFLVSYTENDGPRLLQDADDPTGATITDIDSTTLVSLTVTLTNLIDAGEELLNADVSAFAGITKAYDTTTPGVGVLTISSVTPQPIADYVAVLRTVTYDNSSNAPDTTARVVQFVANDGTLASNTATSTVNLSGVDTAPVAVDDAATVAEDSGANAIDVLANDTDSDGGAISVASVTQPANGAVVITGGGTGLSYAPNANYCNNPPGTTLDTFTYTLTPGGDSATVTVTVTCADDNPTAVADAATVTEDDAATAIDVLANDTDPDGGAISVTSVTQPANGTVVITGGGTGLTYAPNANYCNTPPGTTLDTFTYTLTPGGSSTTVTATVTCVEDDPVAVADAATVAEDSGANAVDVLANDTDPDGGSNSVTSITQPANGTVAIIGGGTGVSYTPNANYCNNPPGTTLDTFTYTLTPGGSSTTVTVTVTCVDDPPIAVADAATVTEDSGANAVDVLANDTDVDGGAISVTSVTQPANGTVAITGGGTGLSYTPNLNYCNDGGTTDGFTYTLSPGGSSTTVAMTVLCVNDAPTATAKAHTTHSAIELEIVAASHTGELMEGAADVDDALGELTAVFVAGSALPAGAAVTVTNAGNGSFRYDPPGGASGAGSFQFQICDDNVGDPNQCSAATTVSFTITGPDLWFVDDSAGTTGDGGLNDPFDSLADLPAGRGTGDRIYVFSGNYATAHSLNASEHLIGQGHSGSSTAHLGVVAVTNGVLDTTPTAGAAPVLGNTTTFAGNNALLRGVAISSGANTGVAGGAFTGVTVLESSLSAAATAANFNGTGASASGVTFSSTNSTAGVNGIVLNNISGSFNFGTGALSGNSGQAFLGTGTLGTTSYAGSLTKTADGNLVELSGAATGTVTLSGSLSCTVACDGIDVLNRGAGTITFSGASKVLNTGASAAVHMDNNDAASIHFTGGGLDIDTTSGAGLNAANGATAFTVQGVNNSITTSTGTALTVANSSIGAGGLTFASISSNGAVSGIVLNGTAASTGRLVVGPAVADGCTSVATCAGGAIQNSTGPAIALTNTRNVSLTELYILNGATHGIDGTGVSDATGGVHPSFELRNSFLESPGDGDNDSAVHFDTLGAVNITGRMVVADTTIQNFEDVGVHIGNNAGTLDVDLLNLTMTNNSDTNGEEGIDIEAQGTAVFTIDVIGGTYTDLEGGGMNVFVSNGSGNIDLNIDNVVVTGTGGPDNFPTPPAITLSSEGASSRLTFDITNSSIVDSSGDGIFVGHEGTIMGRITGNEISGMGLGDGIRLDSDALGSNTMTVLIDNNNIGNVTGNTGIGDDGIQVLHRDGSKVLNLTVTNNQIRNTTSEAFRYFTDDDVGGGGPGNVLHMAANTFGANNLDGFGGYTIQLQTQDAGTELCANVTGNTGVTNIGLVHGAGSTLQLRQASTAALAGENGGAAIVPSGTITTNGACATAPQPTH